MIFVLLLRVVGDSVSVPDLRPRHTTGASSQGHLSPRRPVFVKYFYYENRLILAIAGAYFCSSFGHGQTFLWKRIEAQHKHNLK